MYREIFRPQALLLLCFSLSCFYGCEQEQSIVSENHTLDNVKPLEEFISQEKQSLTVTKSRERRPLTADILDSLCVDKTVYMSIHFDDTLYQKESRVIPISKKGYDYLKSYQQEEKYLSGTKIPVIQKVDSCFYFTLTDGAKDSLCNNRNEYAEMDFRDWHFDKYWSKVPALAVSSQFYESDGYLLIDLENGKRMWTYNIPIMNLSGKRFMSYRSGGIHDNNGVQVIIRKDNDFSVEFSFQPLEWGPKEVLWINDSSLLIWKRQLVYSDFFEGDYDESFGLPKARDLEDEFSILIMDN